MKPTPFHVSTATIEYKRESRVGQPALRQEVEPDGVEEAVEDSGRRMEDRLEDDPDDDHRQDRRQVDHERDEASRIDGSLGHEQREHQPEHRLGDDRGAGEEQRVLDRLPHRPIGPEDRPVVVETDELDVG